MLCIELLFVSLIRDEFRTDLFCLLLLPPDIVPIVAIVAVVAVVLGAGANAGNIIVVGGLIASVNSRFVAILRILYVLRRYFVGIRLIVRIFPTSYNNKTKTKK